MPAITVPNRTGQTQSKRSANQLQQKPIINQQLQLPHKITEPTSITAIPIITPPTICALPITKSYKAFAHEFVYFDGDNCVQIPPGVSQQLAGI